MQAGGVQVCPQKCPVQNLDVQTAGKCVCAGSVCRQGQAGVQVQKKGKGRHRWQEMHGAVKNGRW